MNHQTEINHLPIDIFHQIIKSEYLSFSDFQSLILTNHFFYLMHSENSIWAIFVGKIFDENIQKKHSKNHSIFNKNSFLDMLQKEIVSQKNESHRLLAVIHNTLQPEQVEMQDYSTRLLEGSYHGMIKTLLDQKSQRFLIKTLFSSIHNIAILGSIKEAAQHYKKNNEKLNFINTFIVKSYIKYFSPHYACFIFDGCITRLPKTAIESLSKTSIEILSIAGCGIDYLPEEIKELKQLKTLFLSNNKLYDLPCSLSTLTNLSHLELTNNQLTNIPSSIWQLSNLESLILRNFKTSYNFCFCCEDYGIRTDGNVIKRLPQEIEKLTNLEILDLSNTRLNTIHPNITALQQLTFFGLGYNSLSSIPIRKIDARHTELPNLLVDDVLLYNNPLAYDIKNPWFTDQTFFTSLTNSTAPIQRVIYEFIQCIAANPGALAIAILAIFLEFIFHNRIIVSALLLNHNTYIPELPLETSIKK